MQPRYLWAAVLLLALTLAPLAGGPGSKAIAYAQSTREPGQTTARAWTGWWPLSLYSVSASNENERQDREDRREHGNNANDNNGNGNNGHDNNNGNGNGNEDDCCAPPPPPPQPARQAPPPPQNEASACLGSGGSVSLDLGDGVVTVKVFQDNLSVTLDRVDPGSVPAPPGSIVDSLVFRVSASPCGGSGMGSLPNEGNLGVGYRDRAVGGRDESKFKLMFWDGQRWTDAPKQATDPGANYDSSTFTALGVYALTSP